MESDEEDAEDWDKPVEINNRILNTPDKHVLMSSRVKDVPDTHARVILHIDIDCFYAQVEMIRNPALRNKPLGIQQKYIIVTCNYPAREQGLTKLMTVKDAKEKCPNLVLVSGEDLTNYREMSYKISGYLQKYCPLVERLGFDENFLDMTEMVNTKILDGQPDQVKVKGHIFQTDSVKDMCGCGCHQRLTVGSIIAADIREGLKTELGITCCGGVAHNKLLSKLVAGTHKPNQQTTLFPEQSAELLSRLASVRNIPGIGHTTARRLKDIGIVTVSDLQHADSSILEEEFGSVTMETMKNLSIGVDKSQVVAFGLPQTLSDEDSFKKCCTLTDARLRIKQLLLSLLKRLLDDGRQPHTFRLTIRKLSAGNKYMNRESRQCHIPNNVFSKLSAENLNEACGHLETLSSSLLTKMVDTTQSFHLTLINVAFAKLEHKSANAITNFFSPRSQRKFDPDQTCGIQNSTLNVKGKDSDEKNSCKPSLSNSASGKRKSDSDTEEVLADNTNKRQKSDNSHLSNCKIITNTCTLKTTLNEELPEEIDKDVLNQLPKDIQQEIIANLKSATSICIASSQVNKSCSNYNSNVLEDFCSVKNNKSVTKKDSFFKRYIKETPQSPVENPSTTQYKQHSLREPNTCSKYSLHDISDSKGAVDAEPTPTFDQTSVSNTFAQDLDSATKSVSKPAAESCDQNIISNITSKSRVYPKLSTSRDQTKINSCISGKDQVLVDANVLSSSSQQENTEDNFIPPDIDKSVFISLPQAIQQELIQDWKRKTKVDDIKHSGKSALEAKTGNKTIMKSQPAVRAAFKPSTVSVRSKTLGGKTSQLTSPKKKEGGKLMHETLVSPPHFKRPKPSSSNNILSYFSKSDKKI